MVLLNLDLQLFFDELKAARAAWGKNLLIVGIARSDPYARVWAGASGAKVVEIRPGFLDSFLLQS
jgi:hypothetical protein